jgi:hypothetical protein
MKVLRCAGRRAVHTIVAQKTNLRRGCYYFVSTFSRHHAGLP